MLEKTHTEREEFEQRLIDNIRMIAIYPVAKCSCAAPSQSGVRERLTSYLGRCWRSGEALNRALGRNLFQASQMSSETPV